MLLLSFALISACGGGGGGGGGASSSGEQSQTGFKLLVMPENILANNKSSAVFRLVSKKDDTTVTDARYYVNDTLITDNKFSTGQTGEYRVRAEYGTHKSEEIIVKAHQNRDFPLIEVPVIFHIIHDGEAVGTGANMSAADIDNRLQFLNDAFANKKGYLNNAHTSQASDNPNAVDTRLRFRLARYDRQGNPLAEPGIHRYPIASVPSGWDIADYTYWNPEEYLNFWFYPDSVAKGDSNSCALPKTYESHPLGGLETVEDDFSGTPLDSLDIGCNISYTSHNGVMVHEMGHRVGLMHNFSEDKCKTDDYAPDTYSYDHGTEKLVSQNPDTYTSTACPDNTGPLNAHDNWMDYTHWVHDTFTYDQRERIQYVFKYGLWFSKLKNSTK